MECIDKKKYEKSVRTIEPFSSPENSFVSFVVNQRPPAEHGLFEGPSSYPRLRRWSLIAGSH